MDITLNIRIAPELIRELLQKRKEDNGAKETEERGTKEEEEDVIRVNENYSVHTPEENKEDDGIVMRSKTFLPPKKLSEISLPSEYNMDELYINHLIKVANICEDDDIISLDELIDSACTSAISSMDEDKRKEAKEYLDEAREQMMNIITEFMGEKVSGRQLKKSMSMLRGWVNVFGHMGLL